MAQSEKLAAQFGITGCAKDYLRASIQPFESPAACMPAHMMNPVSRKAKYFCQGTFTTGTTTGAGSASIVLSPDNLANDGTGANSSIIKSSNTSTGTTILGQAAAGAAFAQFNTEFAGASFSAGNLEFRVAAAGLRIQNVTAALYREGTIFAVCEPSHNTVIGMAETDVVKYEEAIIVPDQGDHWVTLVYNGPSNSTDLEYNTGFGLIGPCMGFICKTSGANLQTYRFEAVVHVEWSGKLATGKTPTYSDPIAVSVVNGATKQAHATCGKTDHAHPSFFSAVGSALLKGAHMVSPLIKPAVGMAVRAAADAIPYAPAVLDAAKFAYPLLKQVMNRKPPTPQKMIAPKPVKRLQQKKR